MLSVAGLTKRYQGNAVLRGVDLELSRGEVVGLIGRSGAGKSTLARCLVGLEHPESGQIVLDGAPIEPTKGRARKDIQYLWQDPARSLSPFLSAHKAVLETLNGFRIGPTGARSTEAASLLAEFGLTPDMQRRRPHALSGGQCQRVAMVRALAAQPKVLVLDEPLSALDLTTQIQAIGILKQLHRDTGLTMLIVSHDLAPLRQLAARVLVLDEGHLVEDLPMVHFAKLARHPLAQAYAKTLG